MQPIWKKISENLTIVSKRLEALLEYRRLTEGTIRPQVQKIALSHLVTKIKRSPSPSYSGVFRAPLHRTNAINNCLYRTV